MKAKRIATLFIVFLFIFSLACCAAETEQESFQNSSEDLSQQISQSSDADISQNSSENSEENIIGSENEETEQSSEQGSSENTGRKFKYWSFEEIIEAGYVPVYMQPYSIIIFDADKNPTITEGGEITLEEYEVRDDVQMIGFISAEECMRIEPNTKAEYDLHGFIQNIYYLIPGTESEYQLAPPGY